MQKGNFIQRVLQFAENKGFYMILGLCVVAIGVSAYVLFFTTPEQEPLTGVVVGEEPQAGVSGQVPDVTVPDKQEDKKPPVVQQTDDPQVQEPQPVVLPEAKPEKSQPASAPVEEKPSNAVQVGAQTTVKQPIFTLPVQYADIQREYSGNDLVSDPTMGDWRTHNGVDFACDEGDTVMAVLDGLVAKIYEDALQGTCIRIDHGAGLESLYCGLVATDGLKEGHTVTAGQTIGRVDGSNLSESAQETHLHLEMTEDGLYVDPMTVLK